MSSPLRQLSLWCITGLAVAAVMLFAWDQRAAPQEPAQEPAHESAALGETPLRPAPRVDGNDAAVHRERADSVSGGPSEPRQVYEPSQQQLASYRALMVMCGELSASLPAKPELSFRGWESLREVELAFKPGYDKLMQKSAVRLRDIGRVRDKANLLEVVGTRIRPPGTPGGDDPKSLRDYMQATGPNQPGQLVSLRSRGGVTYINRVNPGDDPEIDQLALSLKSHALLVTDAITTLIARDIEQPTTKKARR